MRPNRTQLSTAHPQELTSHPTATQQVSHPVPAAAQLTRHHQLPRHTRNVLYKQYKQYPPGQQRCLPQHPDHARAQNAGVLYCWQSCLCTPRGEQAHTCGTESAAPPLPHSTWLARPCTHNRAVGRPASAAANCACTAPLSHRQPLCCQHSTRAQSSTTHTALSLQGWCPAVRAQQAAAGCCRCSCFQCCSSASSGRCLLRRSGCGPACAHSSRRCCCVGARGC